jgi:dihydrofolate reductase/thymidylate synthase
MKYIIVAIESNSGIGKNNSLPWDLKKDLRHFSEITKGNVVIMGKHTWLSIPEKHKPLKDRINIVISSSLEIKNTDVKVFKSINDALEYTYTINCNDVYFIGGNKIYKEVIDKNLYDGIYLTQIYKKFECDTFFPNFCKNNIISESEIYEENNISFQFKYYKNNFSFNSEESQYTNIIKEILNNGNEKSDRTGTGTKSLFGKTMRFDLSNGKIPLLTTKRVFWRGVAEELLWFISGNTNAKILQDKNIHIWDGNGSKEYLSSIGLGHREEGDLGEVYGFQWRHYGAEYKTMNDNYDGQGIDQLLNLIETIKTNPNDRRMIITAWNPSALKNMSLPPCHLLSQFYVNDNKLSCQMYQRSADMGLGVPFNIASYSLLTCLIAHCTDLEPGEFIHIIGDAHIYKNHIDPLKEQLKREPREFPTIKINTENKDITKFLYEDLVIENYKPYKSIKMKMSV